MIPGESEQSGSVIMLAEENGIKKTNANAKCGSIVATHV